MGWRQAVAYLMWLIVLAVLALLIGAVVWWVWRYVATEVIRPYRDPEAWQSEAWQGRARPVEWVLAWRAIGALG